MLGLKAIKGAGWLVFSRFVGRGIDFITLLLLARFLSPSDFGLTALAMALIAVVDTVLELPVTQAVTRLRAVDKQHFDTGFTLGVLRSVLICVVVSAAAYPYSLFYSDPRLLPLVAVLMLGPVARGFYSPNMAHYVRELSFRQIFVAEFSGKLVAFAAVVATVTAGGGYWAIVANFVGASVAATIASYVLAPYRPALSLRRFSDFSAFIGWYNAIQIVSAINWQFDRVVLGRFVDKAALGRYAVASDLAVLPTQSLVGPAMQPVMAAFAKINADPARLQLAFLKAARFAMLISVPVCLGISLTADLIVAVLLGPKWLDATPFLQLLALSVLPVPYYQTLYSFSLAVGQPVVLFELNLIDFGVRVLFVAIGFCFFSIVGVAVARVAISAVMFVFCLLWTRNLAGVTVRSQLMNVWKVAAAATVMTGVVASFRAALAPLHFGPLLELLAVGALGGAIYVAGLIGCGVWLNVGPGRLEVTDRWL